MVDTNVVSVLVSNCVEQQYGYFFLLQHHKVSEYKYNLEDGWTPAYSVPKKKKVKATFECPGANLLKLKSTSHIG